MSRFLLLVPLVAIAGCGYPPDQTVEVIFAGADDADNRQGIWDLLAGLVDGDGSRLHMTTSAAWRPYTVRLAPVANPGVFARRIRFAESVRVDGRKVFVLVDRQKLRGEVFWLRFRQFLDKAPDYALQYAVRGIAWWTGKSEREIYTAMMARAFAN